MVRACASPGRTRNVRVNYRPIEDRNDHRWLRSGHVLLVLAHDSNPPSKPSVKGEYNRPAQYIQSQWRQVPPESLATGISKEGIQFHRIRGMARAPPMLGGECLYLGAFGEFMQNEQEKRGPRAGRYWGEFVKNHGLAPRIPVICASKGWASPSCLTKGLKACEITCPMLHREPSTVMVDVESERGSTSARGLVKRFRKERLASAGGAKPCGTGC